MTRADIVSAARSWLGTPYHHQASKCGVGADCLGLLRGVWRRCFGDEPELPPPYSPNWAEDIGNDDLLHAMRRHFIELPISAVKPGDVLLFRMRAGCPAKHCAIISEPDKIIHTYWGRAVTETALVPWWERRIAAAFSFPNLKE